MKVSIYHTYDYLGSYVSEYLKVNAKKYGIDVVNKDREADVILVSVADSDAIPMVRRLLNELSKYKKKIIMGGLEALSGEFYLGLGFDGVWIGESDKFFKLLSEGGINDVMNSEHMLTVEKIENDEKVYYAEDIDFLIAPVVLLEKNICYYLVEKGCLGKCAFCITGWSRKRALNDMERVLRVIDYVRKNKWKLHIIANDIGSIDVVSKEFLSGSLKVRNYLRRPWIYKGIKLIRFGVEGLTEEERRFYGKMIYDEELRMVLELTKEYKNECEWFLIWRGKDAYDKVGSLVSVVEKDIDSKPRVWLKFTVFDPRPHTPLWLYDLMDYVDFNRERVTSMFFENRRIRVFPTRSVAEELIRTVVARTYYYDVEKCLYVYNKVRSGKMSHRQFIDLLKEVKLDYTINPDERDDRIANQNIHTSWRKLRNRMAKRLGFRRWDI